MAEAASAGKRVYLISEHRPHRWAVVLGPDAQQAAYGIRAWNPLGENWRTVYELAENTAGDIAAEVMGSGAEPVTIDGHTFWFSADEYLGTAAA